MKIRKLLSVILTAIIISALFVGCNQSEILTEPGPKDVIYKFSEFTPEGFNYDILVGLTFDGDTVYMLIQKIEAGDDSTVENFYLLKTDISGNVIEKQLLSSATEKQQAAIGYKIYMGIGVGKNDEIYLVRQTYEEEQKTKTEIVLRDGDTETVAADISGKLEPLGVDTSNLYISDFEIDNKGYAYITVNTDSVYVFDTSSGEIVFDNKPISQGGTKRGFYKNDEGEISVVTYKQMMENDEAANKLIINPINPKTGKYGKEEIIDATGGNNLYLAPGDDKFEFYGFNSVKIYGYIKGQRILVADLPASGVPLSDITRVIPVSDTQFFITGYTQNTIGFDKLYMLTKIAPEDVPDKSIITVAAIAEPIYFDDYIKEFSLTHPYFQVEYKQYAALSDASYDQALTAFNNDIIAGNIPDVIVIESEMPYGNYVANGMLADLYPFINNDPDYSREDFLQPLLKAFETDGKLYSTTPAFYVESLVGKTSIFGEEQGQSFEELQAAAAKFPDANIFGTGIDRDVFTERILTRIARGFIDDVNGVCNFDTPEFITLLEFAKNLPTPAPDAELYQFRFIPGETNDYKTDKALIELWNFSDFRHIVSLEKVEFGEPVTFLGYPNDSGESDIIARPLLETAIMAQAKNSDGAWEFIKGLFSYGNYWIESMGYPPMGTFPTLMSELNIAAEKATIPPYETWYGERTEKKNWIGADLSNQPDNTQADNEKMFALFNSISGIKRSTPAIEDIIAEETKAYFTGNKTVEETAAIIQDRATTYLEETRG
jgi:hypothetical protein